VLGADGFIGRHLVAHWQKQGWPVHPVGRAAGDFTDQEVALAALRGAPAAGYILHAITRQRTGVIQYEMQGELLADNARIHLNVLEAWRRHQPQAKLISLGSSCVYPESDRPQPEMAFRSGPPHPSVRGYALAKEILATGCDTYGAQYELRWLHCILATVYGPHAHTEPHRSHFMAAWIARAAAGRRARAARFEVWGSPDTVRDLLYVTDQIEAIVAADAAFENTILNCTANAPVTIEQCARAVLAALDWQVPIAHPAGSFQGARYKSLDSSRFLAATNWRPRVGLEEGVRCVLAADFAPIAPI
jgi:nucleoside-diphosphate-sugar epimerase